MRVSVRTDKREECAGEECDHRSVVFWAHVKTFYTPTTHTVLETQVTADLEDDTRQTTRHNTQYVDHARPTDLETQSTRCAHSVLPMPEAMLLAHSRYVDTAGRHVRLLPTCLVRLPARPVAVRGAALASGADRNERPATVHAERARLRLGHCFRCEPTRDAYCAAG